MTVYFYIPIKNEVSKRFLNQLENTVPVQNMKIFRNLDDFSRMLIKSSDNRRIAVLFLPSRLELLSLFFIRDLLLDIRLLLILPDRKKDTVKMAHAFHPRFLSYTDNNFIEVSAVLKQMLEHINIIRHDL